MRAHWISGCAPSADAPANADLQALGDFDPSPATRVDGVAESTRGIPLSIPAATRAIVADVSATEPGDASPGAPTRFAGVGTLESAGAIDVSLWPTTAVCALSPSARNEGGAAATSALSTQALGVAADSGVVLVTGPRGANKAAALVLDVKTAIVSAVPSDVGPRTRRAGGTITPFGDELLVAAGRDAESQLALGSADVFDPASQAFEVTTIGLLTPRAGHAAVALASGETLLIGGVDANGRPLATLEAVSPDTRAYRVSGLTDLEVSRANPRALRLTDDRILVAGGTDGTGTCTLSPTADPAGNCAPVELMEWLATDASRIDQESTALVDSNGGPATSGRAFVPMPGGSTLVVGGCNLRVPTPAEQADCARFCPNGGCPSSDVVWVSRDGTPTFLPGALDVVAARPVLAAGEDGRPWLIGDRADGTGRALRRFDPWLGKFVCPSDGKIGSACDSDTALHLPADPLALSVSPDPGLVVWLGDEGGTPVLRGFRHGTRGPYSDLGAPLVGGDEGLAFDRAQGLDARLVPSGDSASNAADGGPAAVTAGDVELVAPGATLAVTDATYADVRVAIDVLDGPPPNVALGERVFGDVTCTWPVPTPDAPYTAVLERRRTHVHVSFSGSSKPPSASADCDGPSGRVSVALVGPGPAVRIASVLVQRTLP